MAKNLFDTAKEVYQSFPVPVYMAGFKSDTYTLQKNGWQIATENFYEYGGYALRLALKHEGIKQYAITSSIHLPLCELGSLQSLSRFLAETPLHVVCMGSTIQMQIMNMTTMPAFKAVDATPQITERKSINIADFNIFRPIPTDISDLFVAPEQIPEVMDRIMDLQKPKQREIWEQQRKERMLQDSAGQEINEEQIKYSPARDIKLQIVSCA